MIPSKQLCQERIIQAMPDMEIILLSELAEFVPWAGELAVITAINTIAYKGPNSTGMLVLSSMVR